MTADSWAKRLSRDYFHEFRGRGVILAGGASGIGAALAEGLHYLGARIVLLDRNAAAARALAARLAKSADGDFKLYKPLVVAADLAAEPARKRALAEACRRLGRVNAFVSTLGFDSRGDFDRLAQAEAENLLRINFLAPVLAARDVLPALRRSGGGAVCLFTSRHGSEIAEPDMLGYGGAKAALDGGIRRLAARAGAANRPGNVIRVFGFCPGWVQTGAQTQRFSQRQFAAAAKEQLIPLGMKPADLVPMLVFALSSYAGLLAGTTLRYDGGEGQLRGGAIEAGSRKGKRR
jgi:NAD(P)-dependent dehydrogenase (short-subunit alcohol dehydrogenase family)